MEFDFSLLCWCLQLWRAWFSYLWECFSVMMTQFTGAMKTVLSEERAFPIVHLSDTRRSLPHQWKWALLSPSSELHGNPVTWAFSSSQEKKLHSLWITSPQILYFWREHSGRDFCTHISKRALRKQCWFKFVQHNACCLLTLFFPYSTASNN